MPSSACAIDTPVQSPRSAHQRSCRAQHASAAAAAAPDALVATQRQRQATQRRPQKDRRCARAPHERVLRLCPSRRCSGTSIPHTAGDAAPVLPPPQQTTQHTPQKTQKAAGTAAPTAFAKSVVSHTPPQRYEMRLPASEPAAEVYTSSTCTKQPPFDFTGMPIWANRAFTHAACSSNSSPSLT